MRAMTRAERVALNAAACQAKKGHDAVLEVERARARARVARLEWRLVIMAGSWEPAERDDTGFCPGGAL